MGSPRIESWLRYTRRGVLRKHENGATSYTPSLAITWDTRPRLDLGGWDLTAVLASIGDADAFLAQLLAAAPTATAADQIQHTIDSQNRAEAVTVLLGAVLLADHEKKAAKGRSTSKAEATWQIITACEDDRIARQQRGESPLSAPDLLASVIRKRALADKPRTVAKRSEMRAYFTWLAQLPQFVRDR